MSVKTRQAPKLRPVLREMRIWPVVWQGAAALTAFCAARAPVFGQLLPLGLCVAAAMPPSYVVCAGTGAALGYILGLPAPGAAAYLGAMLAVVLLRLLGGAARYRDLPMAPLYSNEYADLFTEHLQNYRPDTHFSWAAAILDAYVK